MQDAMSSHEKGLGLNIRHHYEVIVGNIGSVYAGPSRRDAERSYRVYVAQSRTGYGRAVRFAEVR